MLSLPGFIKQHLLFSCLVISGALHSLVIFYAFISETEQSAKGEQYTLLLEAGQKTNTKVKNAQNTGPNASKPKESSIPTPTTPQVQTEQPKDPAMLSTKAAPINNSKPNNPSEASNNNLKSNAGDNIDMSGKELTAAEKYQKRVLQHILKKIGSAPYFGSAQVELTLMRAGIAIQIRVELINGPDEYRSWLNHQILSANPMPAFPKNMTESQIKLSFPIHHLKEL